MVKNLPANAGDVGSFPLVGKYPGEENGNPLQYSCLGNPMDRGAWQASPKGCRVRQDLLTKQTTKGDIPGGVINSCTILWLMMR